jgi:hypothetical protein
MTTKPDGLTETVEPATRTGVGAGEGTGIEAGGFGLGEFGFGAAGEGEAGAGEFEAGEFGAGEFGAGEFGAGEFGAGTEFGGGGGGFGLPTGGLDVVGAWTDCGSVGVAMGLVGEGDGDATVEESVISVAGVVTGVKKPGICCKAIGGSKTPWKPTAHVAHAGSRALTPPGMESCGVQRSVTGPRIESVLHFVVHVHLLRECECLGRGIGGEIEEEETYLPKSAKSMAVHV